MAQRVSLLARSSPASPARAPKALHRAAAALRDLLMLDRPRKIVGSRPPELHSSIRAWWQAADARLRVARQLSPETEFAAQVALYREGIPAVVGAALVAVEGSAMPAAVADVRAAWASLERIWPTLGIDVDFREFAAAGRALFETPPPGAPRPDPAEAAIACGAMARLVSLVERAIEPRTKRRLAVHAATRQAVLLVAAALAIIFPLRRMLAPKNLALGRPVTQSSVLGVFEDVGGAGLVNGKLEYGYGFHTDNTGDGHQDPWITIDLGAPTRIGKIAIYNRGDVNVTDCLPLILEVGLDASSMKLLGVRKELFTRTKPWVVDRLQETARYVRVRMTGTAYIALDEIEVYAP